MSTFGKVITAIQGSAREKGEAFVDAHSIRILEHEIVEAGQGLKKAKTDLTRVMVNIEQEGREVVRLENEIKDHEAYAVQALDQGNEALALEVAQKISGLEAQLQEHTEAKATFQHHASQLKQLVQRSDSILRDYGRQLTMLKATEHLQRATASMSYSVIASHSKAADVQSSLERIKRRQAEQADQLKAAESLESELAGKPLDLKLQEAGIIASSEQAGMDVLARIKAQKSG